MSEIDSKWLDKYFEDRPQLKPPPRGLFGYKVDRKWFDVINSLLAIASQSVHAQDSRDSGKGQWVCGFCGKSCVDKEQADNCCL